MTAGLAGLFAASQRLLQAIFVVILGESNDLTWVISTLVVVTTITPLKGHLDAIANRWDAEGGAPSGDAALAGPIVPAETDASAAQTLDPRTLAAIAAEVDQRMNERLAGPPGTAETISTQSPSLDAPADVPTDTRLPPDGHPYAWAAGYRSDRAW